MSRESGKRKVESGASGSSSKWSTENFPPFKGSAEAARDDEESIEQATIDYFKNNPDELEELCRDTNGGEADPEEVKYYRDHPEKVTQLVAKYQSQEEERAKLDSKLEEMSKRGDYDPADDFDGESDRAKKANHFDYHPRVKGENSQEYSKRAEWERMVREKSEQFPRLRGKEAGNPDGSDETNEQWYARVGIPSYEEFMQGDTEAAAGGGEDEKGSLWSKMSEDEKRAFVREHPRNPGESSKDWAKRIGILESGDTSSEGGDPAKSEAEKGHEFDREKALGILCSKEASDWLNGKYKNSEIRAMSDEELERLLQEYLNSRNGESEEEEEEEEEEEGEEEGEEEPIDPEVDNPLVAVALNREKDARAAAHDIAEHWLSENAAKKGIAYNILFGNILRRGTIKRFEKKAYEMIQKSQRGENTTLSESDWAKEAGLEQFVMAHIKGMEEEMIHTAAGEKMHAYSVETVEDEDGTRREIVKDRYLDDEGNIQEREVDAESADAKAAISLRKAIEEYVNNGNKKDFENAIGAIKQALGDAGGNPDSLMADNYLAVAEAARDRVEHGKSIEDVMEGFTFINGEARSNVRTEAHRDAIDKLTNFIEGIPVVGSLLPPEVIGTAASAAVNYGKMPVRAALIAAGTAVVGATMAPAVVPLAVGMGMAGVTSYMRERNRITGDRTTQARDLARGVEATSEVLPSNASRRQRRRYEKRKKYAEDVAETQYDTVGAVELTSAIEKAIESGNVDNIVAAYAQADTAIKMSDREGIDLISYTSGSSNVISDERMKLDIARATAKAKLKELGAEDDITAKMSAVVEGVKDRIETDVSDKDRIFRGMRRRRSAAAGFKSAIVSGAFSIGIQEGVAFVDQGTVGLAETGVNNLAERVTGSAVTENAIDAKNTFLAGLVGLKQVDFHAEKIAEDAELTQQEIDKYKADPDRYQITNGIPNKVVTEQQISSSEALDGTRKAAYSGWLGNGTSESDGNELRGYFSPEKGVYTQVGGTSWGDGRSYDLSSMSDSQLGFVYRAGGQTYCVDAIRDASGNLVPDFSGQPDFLSQISNERLFDTVSLGVKTGVDSGGAETFDSVWTFFGSGDVPATVTTSVETVVPTFTVVEQVQDTITRETAGMFVPGLTRRTNLPPITRPKDKTPENIGGVPRTHSEGGEPNNEPASDSAEGGGETPGNRLGGAFIDSWGGVAEPTPTAPISSVGERSRAGQPVRYDSIDTRISLSDSDIDNVAVGKRVSRQQISDALRTWNSMDDSIRRKLLDGQRGGRTINSYGGGDNIWAEKILVEAGLVEEAEEVESGGMAEAA